MTLRERKKQRTRLALVDAALDLFLAKGYDATTIDEIVGAVDVSQRTFFRYFAAKEDVVLGFMAEYDDLRVETLAGRPAEEPPLTALYQSLRLVLHAIEEGDAEEVDRFRKLRQAIETTPALVAGQMTQSRATERALVQEVARRQRTDPETDLRPQLLVALHMAAVRVGFEDCARHDVFEPKAVVARVEESVALALAALREGWDTPEGPP